MYKVSKNSQSDSHSVVSDSLRPLGLELLSMEFSKYGVGSHFLLQGIFPTQ